jgi:hypothetical protein
MSLGPDIPATESPSRHQRTMHRRSLEVPGPAVHSGLLSALHQTARLEDSPRGLVANLPLAVVGPVAYDLRISAWSCLRDVPRDRAGGSSPGAVVTSLSFIVISLAIRLHRENSS